MFNNQQWAPVDSSDFPFISVNYNETEVAISGDSYQAYKKTLVLFFYLTNTAS